MKTTHSSLGVFCAAVLLFASPLQGQDDEPLLPQYPILRINTEMHTAQIKRFAFDKAETIMATGSDDKTVKLWDLKTGELIRTFRVPIDEGLVGRSYSVDMTPDGKTLAVSGLTGGPLEGQQSLYIFDIETGELLAETTGLMSAFEHLEFSPKADYLIACSTRAGVSVFDTKDWQLVDEDDTYERAMWADWHPSADPQRVAVASYDGYVRVYQVHRGQMRLINKVQPSGGNQPFCVEYSPDGELMAVGFADNTNLDVLNAKDLSFAYFPENKGIEGGDLASVAWSQDGRTLIAGGRYNAEEYNWWFPVFYWDDRGKGERGEWIGMPHTIQQLSTLSGGRTLIGGSGPYWAMLGQDGERVVSSEGKPMEWKPSIADFRGAGIGLWVTEDGSEVLFALDGYAQREHTFSVNDLIYSPLEDDARFFAPDNKSLEIDGWNGGQSITFNGKTLAMDEYETSRTLAIADDQSRFVLGTEWNVRCYDASGEQVWYASAPSITWGVNITPDGRFVVASFSDGSIRWYRISDGMELIALFPHYNGSDWVCWTPEGYYKASPDGERYIGWHVNREPGENPDFFSADQLFELFSDENGILQRVLKEARPAYEIVSEMIAAGEMQPRPSIQEALYGVPEVQFVGGPDDLSVSPSEWIDVVVQATPTAEDVGVRRIELTNNGKRVSESGPLVTKNGLPTQTFSVRLAKGRNELRAVAYSDRRTASYPVRTRVRFEGVRASSDLWVFGVGLEDYQNPKYQLEFCRKDVEETAKALTMRGASIFEEEHFEFLPDSEATRQTIEAKFEELASKVRPEDTFIFIYAGHGTMSEATAEKESQFFLVPYDVTRLYGDNQLLEEKALPAGILVNLLSGIPAQKQVMVLDACHSGAITNVMALAARGAAEEKAIAQLSRATGTAVLASSGAEQFSRGHPELEHGFFSYAFLRGLRDGEADINGDGSVTVNEINQYLNDRVPELTTQYGKPPQYPQSYYRGADFPLGVITP